MIAFTILLAIGVSHALRVNKVAVNPSRNVFSNLNAENKFRLFTNPKGPEKPEATPGKEEGEKVQLPDGKTVFRRVLWATTPWIFNTYEDTKNYVDGQKTIKVTVKDKKPVKYYRDEDLPFIDSKEGTYNMMDSSRAPVVSGSLSEAYQRKSSTSAQKEKVETSNVFVSALKGAATTAARGGSGSAVIGDPTKWRRPKKTLILYEYEGSPFCKKVREAMSMLDLIVEYRPCPGARYGFSDQLSTRTKGSRTVPYLVDPGNSIGALSSMGESDDIIRYLFENFGPGEENIPSNLKGKISGLAATFTGGAANKLISGAKQDNIVRKTIDIWGFEGSPAVRPVRETLCGLALPHRMINVAKGSENIKKFPKTPAGKVEVPYLEDPNTGTKLFGSGDIVKYLLATYTSK